MSTVTYVAARGVIGSHTLGASYTLEFAGELLAPTYDVVGTESVSLSGLRVGRLHRFEHQWQVQTPIIDEADVPAWEEFLKSVAAKERFTFDAYGTTASPDNAETVVMIGRPTRTREGSTKRYRFSFNVAVVS